MSESIKMYEFVEPHITGGDSLIVISEYNIIKYMKEHVAPQHTQVLSDKELAENFCAIFWAKPYNDLESRIKNLEQKIEEAREELLNYKVKYNNQCAEMNRLKQSRKDQLAMIRKLKG